jgi:hypothetical protein
MKALFAGKMMEPDKPEPAATPEKQVVAASAEHAATETAPAEKEPGQETTETKEPEVEDVQSLRTRMQEREKHFEEQLSKARQQGSQGIEWSRALALRKASESAAAKALLRRIKAGEQVPAEEVDKILASETDVSPLAAQSQPALPTVSNPFAPAPSAMQGMDDFMVSETQQFMFDHGLDEDGAEKFIAWMKEPGSPLTSRDVVPNSMYHTLASAYRKYEHTKSTDKSVKAKAVASIARTQKEASKAAGALASRASPSPPADKPVDWTKLPTEERARYLDVDELFRQVAQH